MALSPVPIPRRFVGRSVVVTGAGTGFGAEIAVRAAQEGARVVGVHYRSSAAGAERTAKRVRAEGAEAVLLKADIVEWAQVAAMADEAFEKLGGSIHPREAARFEITHVPASIRERDRLITGRNRRDAESERRSGRAKRGHRNARGA